MKSQSLVILLIFLLFIGCESNRDSSNLINSSHLDIPSNISNLSIPIYSESGDNFISNIWNKVKGSNKKEKKKTSKTSPKKEEKPKTNFTAKAKADKEMNEQRIYLVDLTRSMEGFNGSEDIFSAVKNNLKGAISAIADTSTLITIIPFTNKPLEVYSNKISNRDSILNYVTNLKTQKGDTNILEAWEKGESMLDDSKINYMFMLTDGIHNFGEPIDSLYQSLSRWEDKTKGKYQFAFYVMLTKDAEQQQIWNIANNTKQMWPIRSMNINTDFVLGKMNLTVNIINNNRVKIYLPCTNPEIFNNGFSFKLTMTDNEYYRIINPSNQIDKDGMYSFEIQKLKPQKDLPVSFRTTLNVNYDKEKHPMVFFTPEEYNLNIVNVGTRVMYIKKPIR